MRESWKDMPEGGREARREIWESLKESKEQEWK